MTPKFDYSAWQFWFNVFQGSVTVLLAVYVLVTNRRAAKKKDMADISDTVSCIGHRVTALETEQKNNPSHRDIGDIYDRISGVEKQVNTMAGEMKGIKTSVGRIEVYLLNNGG